MTRPAVPAEHVEPTGERFEPEYMHGRLMEAEHLARYAWAAQFADGRRILDAACGCGYGTAILAAAGATGVVGIDLDETVVTEVRKHAPDRVRFDVGDIRSLPYGDDEFDLVVCFEAIEHVPEPGKVLDELQRVLRPGGVVTLSTPNRDVYTPGNPFHLRELTPSELEAELASRFDSVALRRQHTWAASGIFDDDQFRTSDHRRIEDAELRKAYADEPGGETFTLALAGDCELPVDRACVSLTADADLREWSERLERAAQKEAAAEREAAAKYEAERDFLQRELAGLRERLAMGEAETARLTGVESRLEEITPLLREQAAVARDYEAVITSASWRLTRPLRALSARLRRLRR